MNYEQLSVDDLKIVYKFKLDGRRERARQVLEASLALNDVTTQHWRSFVALQNIRLQLASVHGAVRNVLLV